MKIVDLQIIGNRCYYKLTGCSNDEFVKIREYKSWTFRSWQFGVERKYFVFVHQLKDDIKIIWSSVGFTPILIRYLQGLGYFVNGKELFRSKEITIQNTLFNPRDYQSDAINAWIKNGCFGVVKLPTGAGKSFLACNVMQKMGVKTIVCVHTNDLLINAWYNTLIEQFGEGIKSKLGIIGGKLTKKDRKRMRLLTDTSYEENIKQDIIVATSQSLLNKLDKLCNERIGLLIVDECLPYNTIINTSKNSFEIGKLYDIYNNENTKYLVERMKVDSLDVLNKKIVKCNFIPKKTIVKNMYELKTETGIKFIVSDNHKCLNYDNSKIINYKESKYIKNVGYSLMRSYNNEEECVKARIFGYMLGDGNLNSDTYSAQIYGTYEDMIRINNDLKNLGYEVSYVRNQVNVESEILTEDNEILSVCGDVCTIGLSSIFGHYISNHGYPSGKKTNVVYNIPNWIMNGSLDVKKEFLAGYMGAEGSKIRARIKRCFEVIRVSYHKREDLIFESMNYCNQLIKLFNDLEVLVTNVTIEKGNIRKDGTLSKKVVISFSNENNSMLNLLNIGYRYCKDREIYCEIIRQYLLYSKINNDKVKITCDYALELYTKSYSDSKITEIIQNMNNRNVCSLNFYIDNIKIDKYKIEEKKYCEINKSLVDHWISSKRKNVHVTKSKYNIMEFEEWLNKVDGDIIFLNIISRNFIKEEQGYDLEVLSENHNYFINDGINVHNCHHYSSEQFNRVASSIRAPYRLGLSATMNRPDGTSPLFYGLLGDIVYSIEIRKLINKGVLVHPIFNTIVIDDKVSQLDIATCGLTKLNLSRHVKKISASSIIKKNYILKLAKDLCLKNKKFIMYTDFVNVREFTDEEKFVMSKNNIIYNDVFTRDFYVKELISNGIRAIGISSDMTGNERSKVFDLLQNNKIDGLVFGKLGAEGVNVPRIDSVIMCNGTKSTIFYTQRVGRSLRTMKNDVTKKNAFIYEILLNTPMELQWSNSNFYEYEIEGYEKNVMQI